mgnify:CR=1 FL=1
MEPEIILESHSTQEHSIRFLTLNLLMRPPMVKNNSSDYKNARVQYFSKFILPNFDIVCLQEIFGSYNKRRKFLIKRAKEQGFEFYAVPHSANIWTLPIIDGGLLILSKYPILESDFMPYEKGVLPDSLSKKGVLYAKISTPQEVIHVFTSHTQSSYNTGNEREWYNYRSVRREQLKQLKQFISYKLGNKKELAVLMGDLNVDARESQKGMHFTDGDDYECMMRILGGKDIIREKYGYSPATNGIVINGVPTETVLTVKDEVSNDAALDYVIAFNSKFSSFSFDLDESRVEPFYIQSQPFTQISDHAGIITTIKFTGTQESFPVREARQGEIEIESLRKEPL